MILINNNKINFTTFPNGETCIDGKQIKNIATNINNVILKYNDDSDLIKLMFVKKYLDSLNKKSILLSTYFPYSRMDRIEGDSVFTLKYITNFINTLNFDEVIIFEPHSDVTPALLNNCRIEHMSVNLLKYAIADINFNKDIDYIYYPDASAAKHFGKDLIFKSLTGLKQRDFVTGRIKKLDIAGELPTYKGFKAIMIDDLCSRGGTFMLGANKLKELGASNIYLVITHCENSIFEGDILNTDIINKVYTTNSILDKTNKKIKILDILGGNK